jgi:hypothetical protein
MALKIDKLGGILVTVRLPPEPWLATTLSYEFDIDQSYLPGLISDLDGLLEQYPPGPSTSL